MQEICLTAGKQQMRENLAVWGKAAGIIYKAREKFILGVVVRLEGRLARYVEALMGRYPELGCVREDIACAYQIMEKSYGSGGKLLIAGNGGSAADAEHIAGELMKRFRMPRPVSPKYANKLKAADPRRGAYLAKTLEQPLTAIPLAAHGPLLTACLNDVGGLGIFAQQLYGLGKAGDVFLGISTSGNSEDILYAATVALASGLSVVGLTGAGGGSLASMADVTVKVPETEAYRAQELHLPIYHCWCMMLEDRFFGEAAKEQGSDEAKV